MESSAAWEAIITRLPFDQIERVNCAMAKLLVPIASAQSMHRPWSMNDRTLCEMVKNVETGGGRRVAVASVRQHSVSP